MLWSFGRLGYFMRMRRQCQVWYLVMQVRVQWEWLNGHNNNNVKSSSSPGFFTPIKSFLYILVLAPRKSSWEICAREGEREREVWRDGLESLTSDQLRTVPCPKHIISSGDNYLRQLKLSTYNWYFLCYCSWIVTCVYLISESCMKFKVTLCVVFPLNLLPLIGQCLGLRSQLSGRTG